MAIAMPRERHTGLPVCGCEFCVAWVWGKQSNTRGANVPALNDLLASWRIQFGDRIFDGEFSLGQSEDRATVRAFFIYIYKIITFALARPRLTIYVARPHVTQFASGTAIASFPRGGTIVSTTLDDQTEEIIRSRNVKEKVHVLGLYAPPPVFLSSSSSSSLSSS